MNKGEQAVCDMYGVEAMNELFTNIDFNQDMQDSVFCGFCTSCGEEADGVIESDGEYPCDNCEDGTVKSVQYIVLGF